MQALLVARLQMLQTFCRQFAVLQIFFASASYASRLTGRIFAGCVISGSVGDHASGTNDMQATAAPNVGAPARKWNKTVVNLVVDMVFFVVFLITMAPRFGGSTVHEWISTAMAAIVVGHVLLHWNWIINTLKRCLQKMNVTQRTNSILNTILFIDSWVIMLSGFLISESILPGFGIRLPRGIAWRQIHDQSANLAMLIIGLHIALHWPWIVAAFKRLVLRRPTSVAAKVSIAAGK